jgi:hypothetical protein
MGFGKPSLCSRSVRLRAGSAARSVVAFVTSDDEAPLRGSNVNCNRDGTTSPRDIQHGLPPLPLHAPEVAEVVGIPQRMVVFTGPRLVFTSRSTGSRS